MSFHILVIYNKIMIDTHFFYTHNLTDICLIYVICIICIYVYNEINN